MAIYNDCGVDGKKKYGEHEGAPNTEKKIFVKKKNEWNDKTTSYHFVDSKANPQNNCKINKQLHLQSININETIFDGISKELDIGNETCLGDYKKDSKCGLKTVYYLDGRVEKTEGDYFEENGMCYYGIEENYEEELCNSTFGEGHYQMNHCYHEAGEETTNNKAGCYKMNSYSNFCEEEGYKLENDQCVKTIDATIKE